MTLTLDEVRRIRFPMARRPGEGYRAGEVDDFVDKVDATFAAIVDENDRLKAQLDALKKADGAAGGQPDAKLNEENTHLKAQLEELRAHQQEAGSAELERSRIAASEAENKVRAAQQEAATLRSQLEEARRSATQQTSVQGAGAAEVNRLRTENERLNSQLKQARNETEAARRAAAASPAKVASTSGAPDRIQVSTSAEAAPAVVRMVELAIADAERVVHEAHEEADRKMADAEKKAHEHIVDAQTRAERIESAARVNSERVTSEARATAEKVTTDAQARRNELFGELESERDDLTGKVDQLRAFENNYRDSIISHLRSQAENIEKGVFEPTATADLVRSENRVAPGSSATPRLDALITGRSQQN
ncbi:DivIVA domain-containing protein [Acidipropionibacterium virtanenii]|uniref:Cell wall synthesis protein Wag31 n=1 Tax=Acidipropionibacterium virtanenii TaxID=2057246 RepID=A0A344UV88_9ACTN|nr:DivIVA domain-containing protein [Acidipropionibacterium virtanenii]AXE39186.1 Cell wall synthesis protein Wag31 [Acidipropionibacterium virtanenii]